MTPAEIETLTLAEVEGLLKHPERFTFTQEATEALNLRHILLVNEHDNAEIERVKRRHNVTEAYLIKVPLNDDYTEFATGFIRYPSRMDVSIAMTYKETDPLKGKEIVLRNSWLEGDNSILDNDKRFLSATTILDTVLSIRQAIVKKN